MPEQPVSIAEIRAAAARIANIAFKTPLVRANSPVFPATALAKKST